MRTKTLLFALSSSVLTLVAVLLTFDPRARAEFLDLEKVEVRKLLLAQLDLGTGHAYLWTTARDFTDAENQPQFADAVRSLAMAQGELTDALRNLLGAGSTSASPPPSRPDQLSTAFGRLDRALWFASNCRETIAALRRLRTDDVTYQDQLRRASDIWLAGALARIASFNRTLGYPDPNPEDHPKFAGPHGRYDRGRDLLWTAIRYAQDAQLGVASLYTEADPSLVSKLYEPTHRFRRAVEQETLAFGLIAGVYATDAEKQKDESDSAAAIARCKAENRPTNCDQFQPSFFRLLRVDRHLTRQVYSSAASRYHEAQVALVSLLPTPLAPSPTLGFVMRRLTDSWRHMDWFVWETLVFPDLES